MIAQPRHVEGKRIVRLELHPFSDGRGKTAYAPVITLEDGSRLHFHVQETEGGAYGVRIDRNVPYDVKEAR